LEGAADPAEAAAGALGVPDGCQAAHFRRWLLFIPTGGPTWDVGQGAPHLGEAFTLWSACGRAGPARGPGVAGRLGLRP